MDFLTVSIYIALGGMGNILSPLFCIWGLTTIFISKQVIMGGITLGRPACTKGTFLGEIRGFRKSPGAYKLSENQYLFHLDLKKSR